jgi:hypothetical protein
MKTIYDLVSMIAFAGLAILYLQRSASSSPDPVALWKYAVAAFGCELADYFGDHGMPLASIATFVALAIFSVAMLKPFHVKDRES